MCCHALFAKAVGELESTSHFLLHFTAFARLKLIYCGRHTIDEPSKIAGIVINRLNKFVMSTKRFVDLLAPSDPPLGVYG